MSKFEELLKKLKKLEIIQSGKWEDDIPADIFKEYFSNYEVIDSDYDTENGVHCTFAFVLVRVLGSILGISQVKSVKYGRSISSIDHKLEFYKTREIKVTSYRLE